MKDSTLHECGQRRASLSPRGQREAEELDGVHAEEESLLEFAYRLRAAHRGLAMPADQDGRTDDSSCPRLIAAVQEFCHPDLPR